MRSVLALYVLLVLGSGSFAQQPGNTLLSTPFWQSKPTLEAVKAEIAKGNSPTEMNSGSFDPVVLSINNQAGDDIVKYLFEQKGNDVNKITHDGRTYVFWAAYRGNTELMKYFISKGAKMDLVDDHGYSVFNFAATTGQQNTAVYDLCLQHGSDPKKELNNDGANALLLAIGTDPELKLTNYFESKGLSIHSTDAAGANAFDYAARTGNMDVMKKLLAKKVNPTAYAMLMAAQGTRRGPNGLPVFQYLESLGVKPTASGKTGETALHAVVRRPGQTEVINYFLSKGADVNATNESGNTVFMSAAAYNRDSTTLSLLKPLTKNINQSNKNGETALTLAVLNNSPYAVEYLLGHGADVQVTDTKGNTLVYYLFDSYSPSGNKSFQQKLKILQAAGLKMTAPLKDGNTLYHLAVAKEDIGLLEIVQPFGIDINAKNNEGMTPLHKAALIAKNPSLMKYLVEHGAKKDTKTNFNETAYDLARENELLKKQSPSLDFLK